MLHLLINYTGGGRDAESSNFISVTIREDGRSLIPFAVTRSIATTSDATFFVRSNVK